MLLSSRQSITSSNGTLSLLQEIAIAIFALLECVASQQRCCEVLTHLSEIGDDDANAGKICAAEYGQMLAILSPKLLFLVYGSETELGAKK